MSIFSLFSNKLQGPINVTNKTAIIDMFDYIGYHGPVIFTILVSYFVWTRPKYLFAYFVFLFLNGKINGLLKSLIKQPRPTGQKYSDIDSDIFTNEHIYGMPSGHAQSVGFSAMYLFMTTASFPLLLVSALIMSITLYQRFKYRRHSVEQLAVGSIVGSGFGYFAYYIMNQKILSYKKLVD
jgi:membrane-associated phospholipid phosphatase